MHKNLFRPQSSQMCIGRARRQFPQWPGGATDDFIFIGMLPFDDRPHRQASSGDILSAVRALNAPPLPAVAPDPSPQASATCARELLPAARQLALSMSQRPAAGRGFPGPCLTRPRRGAAPAPAPERSGALKRSSAVHAPSGSSVTCATGCDRFVHRWNDGLLVLSQGRLRACQ